MDLVSFSMEQIANAMSVADHASVTLNSLASAVVPDSEPTTCTLSKCTWG